MFTLWSVVALDLKALKEGHMPFLNSRQPFVPQESLPAALTCARVHSLTVLRLTLHRDMRKALGLAAVSCALGLADFKALTLGDNEPRWIPACETFAGKRLLGVDIEPPTPTPPPQIGPRGGLGDRDVTSRTCAYISGLPGESRRLMVCSEDQLTAA